MCHYFLKLFAGGGESLRRRGLIKARAVAGEPRSADAVSLNAADELIESCSDGWGDLESLQACGWVARRRCQNSRETSGWWKRADTQTAGYWQGVSTYPALYLFIGHLMRDRHDAARFWISNRQTTEKAGGCLWVKVRRLSRTKTWLPIRDSNESQTVISDISISL